MKKPAFSLSGKDFPETKDLLYLFLENALLYLATGKIKIYSISYEAQEDLYALFAADAVALYMKGSSLEAFRTFGGV